MWFRDPSPVTAYGVFQGIKASVKFKLGKDSLEGIKVAVQGTGAVGSYLCKYLHEEGALLTVADINEESVNKIVEKFGASVMDTNSIHTADVDVFAPCALGGILNGDTIPHIKAPIVAGGANNQLLEEDSHGQMVKDAGILYAPDYVINSGGLINVCAELKSICAEEALSDAKRIYETMLAVYEEAERQNIPTHKASDLIASNE